MMNRRPRISMRTLAVGLVALVGYGAALTTPAQAQAPAGAAPSGSGPAQAGAQSSTIQMSLDSPADGLAITNGARVLLGGWAADTTANGTSGDSGVDVVRIYFDGPMESGFLLGTAHSGGTRPDVASSLGNPLFARSGFDFVWIPTGVGSGPHTLFVYAHSTVSDSWAYRTVAIDGPAGSVARPPLPPAPMAQAASAGQAQTAPAAGFRVNPYQGPPTPYGGSYLNTSLNDAANYLGGQSRYGAGYGGYLPPPDPCSPLPAPGVNPTSGSSTTPAPPVGGGCATASPATY